MVRRHGASVIAVMAARSSAKAVEVIEAEPPFTSEVIATELLFAAVPPLVKARLSAAAALSAARGASNRAALPFAAAADRKAAWPRAEELAGRSSVVAVKVEVQRCVPLGAQRARAAVALAAAELAQAVDLEAVDPEAVDPEAAVEVDPAGAAAADAST
jgi:hypothetical protein